MHRLQSITAYLPLFIHNIYGSIDTSRHIMREYLLCIHCIFAIMIVHSLCLIINIAMQQDTEDNHIFDSVKSLGIACSGIEFSRLLGRSENYFYTCKSMHRMISADSLLRLAHRLSSDPSSGSLNLAAYVEKVAIQRAGLSVGA